MPVPFQQNLDINNVGILIKIQATPVDTHMRMGLAAHAARPHGSGRAIQKPGISSNVLGSHSQEDPKGSRHVLNHDKQLYSFASPLGHMLPAVSHLEGHIHCASFA